MSAKFLIVLAATYLAWRALRTVTRQWLAPPTAPAGRGSARPVEKLVRCTACGVHLPETSALTSGAAVFCSSGCRQAAAQGGG